MSLAKQDCARESALPACPRATLRFLTARAEFMRQDSMAVLVIKSLSMEWGKMGWEWAFAGLNGLVRIARCQMCSKNYSLPKSVKSARVSGAINVDELLGDLSTAIYSGASAFLPASLGGPAFFEMTAFNIPLFRL